MSKQITLGVRLPEQDYNLVKELAEQLNMSLSQFGEQALLSCCEIIKIKKKPELTKFLKGSRYWVHEADNSKQNF
jgi:hypothetical protein